MNRDKNMPTDITTFSIQVAQPKGVAEPCLVSGVKRNLRLFERILYMPLDKLGKPSGIWYRGDVLGVETNEVEHTRVYDLQKLGLAKQ